MFKETSRHSEEAEFLRNLGVPTIYSKARKCKFCWHLGFSLGQYMLFNTLVFKDFAKLCPGIILNIYEPLYAF